MSSRHSINSNIFRPARYGVALPWGKVECRLCPHGCVLDEGESGRCRVRANRRGVLVTRAYGEIVIPPAKDRIEAKPFYHFLPGSIVTTVGGIGCTMACPYCYNWPLVRYHPRTSFLSIQALCEAALSQGSRAVVFGYNEPVVWAEYLLEASQLLREMGLLVAAVTNGFVSGQARKDLLGALDAVLVDVKDSHSEFYTEVLQGDLDVTWSTLEEAYGRVHLEVKWVVLPKDSPRSTVRAIARRLAEISPEIPLHIARYYPHYRWTAPPTDRSVLRLCREEARRYLYYVYAPETGDGIDRQTTCPRCGQILVSRDEDRVAAVGLGVDGKCTGCGAAVPIRIEPEPVVLEPIKEKKSERVP